MNPRQQVLQNFKEISRIMTSNYVNKDKNYKKYSRSCSHAVAQ